MNKLLILLLIYNVSFADTAVDHAARALYQQQHWDEDVAKFLQYYQNKLTPTEKRLGGYVAFVVRSILDKRVEFIWRF